MKRSRFTQEQIIGVLKEHQAGATAADLCRKHGISDATFYTWRSKFGGMEVSDARKLKGLEEENAKLKKLLAEQMLEHQVRWIGWCSGSCCQGRAGLPWGPNSRTWLHGSPFLRLHADEPTGAHDWSTPWDTGWYTSHSHA